MPTLAYAKRVLREHPYSRTFYHVLAGSWARSRIFVCEHIRGRYHTAARFDHLFAETADPWGYCGDPDSEERRELILGMLPRNRYSRLLEIGCAAGWMTVPLASRADDLLAVDISTTAIARAREKCRLVANVRFMKVDLLTDSIKERSDGIVCAGVLGFLPAAAQEQIRNGLVAALEVNGDLLVEHTTRAYPGEMAGSEIHALYRRHPELRVLQHAEKRNYAITLFRRVV